MLSRLLVFTNQPLLLRWSLSYRQFIISNAGNCVSHVVDVRNLIWPSIRSHWLVLRSLHINSVLRIFHNVYWSSNGLVARLLGRWVELPNLCNREGMPLSVSGILLVWNPNSRVSSPFSFNEGKLPLPRTIRQSEPFGYSVFVTQDTAFSNCVIPKFQFSAIIKSYFWPKDRLRQEYQSTQWLRTTIELKSVWLSYVVDSNIISNEEICEATPWTIKYDNVPGMAMVVLTVWSRWYPQ